MADLPKDMEFRIARLKLAPGEILVVKTSEDIPAKDWIAMEAQFREMMPFNNFLLVSGDVELSVLTPAPIVG